MRRNRFIGKELDSGGGIVTFGQFNTGDHIKAVRLGVTITGNLNSNHRVLVGVRFSNSAPANNQQSIDNGREALPFRSSNLGGYVPVPVIWVQGSTQSLGYLNFDVPVDHTVTPEESFLTVAIIDGLGDGLEFYGAAWVVMGKDADQ